MIELSHPWLLWALPAALAPLLVYWLRRRTRRRRSFPALKLVREAVAEQSRSLKLRELLLTALRILALGLVIFAASGPLYAVDGAPPRRVVVMLDRSLSMSVEDEVGMSRWDRAVSATAGFLRALPADCVVELVAFDTVPRPVDGGSTPEAALRALGGLEVGVGGTDLEGALGYAALLAGEVERTTTLILSDFPPVEQPEALAFPGRLLLTPVGGLVANSAVLDLRPANPLPLGGVSLELSARLHGPLRWYILREDGREIDRRETAGEPGFLTVPQRPGWRVYSLEAETADAFAADDSRFLAQMILPPPGVLNLSASRAVGALLRSSPGLLVPVADADEADVVIVDYERLAEAPGDKHILALVSASQTPPSDAELGLSFRPPVVSPTTEGGGPLALRLPRRGDNPVADLLADVAESFEELPLVQRAPRAALGDDWRTLLEYANGFPALALRETPPRRILLWLLPGERADGELTASEAWAPLMLQSLRFAAHPEPPEAAYHGGDTLRLAPGEWLIDPLGERHEAVEDGAFVELGLLGIWRRGDANDRIGRPLAVNAPAAESALGEPAVEQYLELLEGDVRLVPPELLPEVPGEAPVPLWRWLILLAALLLSLELIISLSRRDR